MTRTWAPLAILVSGVVWLACQEAPGTPQRNNDITAGDMRARIDFLASDMLLGRATPSRGLDIAAQYIATEFRRFGLERPKGGYVQRYRLVMTEMGDGWSLAFSRGGRRAALQHRTDFWGLPWAAGRVEGRLRFVGAQPPTSVQGNQGAIVWVARLGPGATPREWLNAASDAGVVGLIFVLPRELEPQMQSWLGDGDSVYELGDLEPNTPAAMMFEETLLGAMSQLGFDPDLASSQATDRAGVTIELAADLSVQTLYAPNVVGILPGSDPVLKEEYVLISAHMDHLGVGPAVDGDSIYNGADDNASGTAAVLEIAEAAAALEPTPKRSLLFIALSGEERGLLGSAWFVRNPPIPLERAVANLNIDMVGRNWQDTIAVIGKPYSSLGALIDSVAKANHGVLKMTAVGDLWPSQGFFFRSDHFNFARVGIPAVFFFNGFHADYHQPSDEIARIDFAKAARVTRLIFESMLAVANGDEPPRWDERARRAIVEGQP